MKYYVTFGHFQYMVLAGNIYNACVLTLRAKTRKFMDNIPIYFRVSNRGFDKHKNDDIVQLCDIIWLLQLGQINEEENYVEF
ncbi:hypothetical protein LCGC14_2060950 [marine sediment metagenome]|uniref:Uncharacterized protein n=1 Tax=marine sediment metagenome TaxID=412755 RepID=A0A0F9GZQ5_9ZZZZ